MKTSLKRQLEQIDAEFKDAAREVGRVVDQVSIVLGEISELLIEGDRGVETLEPAVIACIMRLKALVADIEDAAGLEANLARLAACDPLSAAGAKMPEVELPRPKRQRDLELTLLQAIEALELAGRTLRVVAESSQASEAIRSLCDAVERHLVGVANDVEMTLPDRV
jgi:hypothetical protein